MSALAAAKSAARAAAEARRAAAHALGHPAPAARLARVLAPLRGLALAGYLPIRTEIDPRPAMAAALAHGPVCVPVIIGPEQPLRFARWTPDTALIRGPFGAMIPAEPDWISPRVVIAPLLAFDLQGMRLGYGGGYYDRSLAALRSQGPVMALGFAWAAQEAPALPQEATDQPLDLIVTEAAVIRPAP